jgi:hypothetical protein
MDDELEAVAVEHGVILVTRHALHGEGAGVEGRDSLETFDEQDCPWARCFHIGLA